MKRIIYSLLLYFVFSFGFAQEHSIHVVCIDNRQDVIDKLALKQLFKSKSSINNDAKELIPKLYKEGYFAASVDSVISDSNSTSVHLFIGDQYKWARLKKGNVDEQALSKIGFRDKIYNGTLFNKNQLCNLFTKIITHYENHGYPFASIKMDSVQVNENAIEGTLFLQKNSLIRIDSIVVSGNAKITPIYLQNYIDIKPNSLYNEKNISNISIRLKELPFVTEKETHQLLFTNQYTKLNLFVANKNASKFDGIVGILPSENRDRPEITADVRLLLVNSVGRGEILDIIYRRIQQGTDDIKINGEYPFILNSPFGIQADFLLYRRDTLFFDNQFGAAIQYLLPRGNYFKVFSNQKRSEILNSENLTEITTLPQRLDATNTTSGLGLKSEKLDYRYNPRKGHSIVIDGGIGIKQIKKNPNIPEHLYDTLELKTIQFNGSAKLDYFIPIAKQMTFKLGLNSAYRWNKQLFVNELYRIGGLKTLRGFDEESLNASFFAIGTTELRFLFEQNSFGYLFFDGAYYENASLTNSPADTPFGFGGGVSFQTNAGIFSLAYALGHQNGELAPLNSGKIHFGFVSFF